MPPLRASYLAATAQQPGPVSAYASSTHAGGSYGYHSNSPRGGDYCPNGSSRERGHHELSDPRDVRPRHHEPSPASNPPHSPSYFHLPPHPHYHPYSHPSPHPHPPSTMATAGPSRRARSPSSQSQDGDEGSSPIQESKGRNVGQGPRTIQSKVCVNCRRSKVKCVNDGSGGPCRRCTDIKLECKWRLRVDDESWRESVEKRFSQLSSKVDAIASSPPTDGRKSDCARSPSASGEVYQHPEWRNLHSKPGAMLPPPTASSGRQLASAHSPSYPSSAGAMHKTSPRSDVGSSASVLFNDPSPRERLPPPAALLSGADVTMSNGDYGSWTPSGRPRSVSSAKLDGCLPSPLSSGRDQKVVTPLPDIARGFDSSQKLECSSIPSIGQLAPITYQDSAPQTPNDALRRPPTIKPHGLPVQWEAGSYASAASCVGDEDPRPNVIAMGLMRCSRVKELFVYFGKNMQSHSFGFPTFPPDKKMTPLIVASVSLAASLFDPAGRTYSPAIMKVIAEQADLAGADSLTEEQHLNRELGVGVEEITGLCVAASWLSGEEGNRMAKVARYWALAYLRQFEARMDPRGSPADREKTWNEWMTMQPAYRVVEEPLRLRIWLESYIVDAAASIIHGRELFAPSKTASSICEELRQSLLKPRDEDNQATRSELSTEDIQLLGHASILDIFVAARGVIAENRDAEKSLRELQYLMEEELEIWRERTSKDTDLAQNTPIAVDLGLTYYLARAYIGNLALSFNLSSGSSGSSGSPRSPLPPSPSASCARVQYSLVNQAKESALMALQIAQESLPERLLRLPMWQHFLLSHAGSFLLRLLVQPTRWFVTAQSYHILTSVECYARLARNHLDVYRAQTPCSFSSSFSSGGLDSSPAYSSNMTSTTAVATTGAEAAAGGGATMMKARGSSASSSSSHTAVEVGAGGGDGSAGAEAKEEEEEHRETEAEADLAGKHAAASAPAAVALGGVGGVGGGHPAAEMIEELYWGAIRMRAQLVG